MRSLKKSFCFIIIFSFVFIFANFNSYATENEPMDLSDWSSIILAKDRDGHATPNWKLGTSNTTITQTLNSKASAYINNADCVNKKIEGTFSVDSAEDDDFIGFVFGYRDIGHYYLFDWKQSGTYDNTFGDTGKQGMSIKVVNTDSVIKESDLWSTSGSDNKIKALYHNNMAYSYKTIYNFSLTFTDKGEINIIIKQGSKILDDITVMDNTYNSGSFGFYNFSQPMVTYTNFTIRSVAPILNISAVEDKKVDLTWTAVSDATNYMVKRSTTQGGPYETIAENLTETFYSDVNVINGTKYYYIVSAVNAGEEIGNSNEASATPTESQNPPITDSKLKVVLEVAEVLRLSVDNDLNINTQMSWSSSEPTVATVNEKGIVTALAPGNTVITVKSADGSYTDYINVLVVENADDYRLAIDLKAGETARLTADDFTNTANVTWAPMDSSIANVTTKGKVTALSKGLVLISAKDADGNIIGRVYVRVRE